MFTFLCLRFRAATF